MLFPPTVLPQPTNTSFPQLCPLIWRCSCIQKDAVSFTSRATFHISNILLEVSKFLKIRNKPAIPTTWKRGTVCVQLKTPLWKSFPFLHPLLMPWKIQCEQTARSDHRYGFDSSFMSDLTDCSKVLIASPREHGYEAHTAPCPGISPDTWIWGKSDCHQESIRSGLTAPTFQVFQFDPGEARAQFSFLSLLGHAWDRWDRLKPFQMLIAPTKTAR